MIKLLVTTIFIFSINFLVVGLNFYVSSATGNDANNGGSESQPWKTLSKLNSSHFGPGDKILFKRGDTFYGSIVISGSGTNGSPITYGAYGSGKKPVITGFRSVTEWTNKGGNIWESSNAVSTLDKLGIVLIEGINTAMGRYPNGEMFTFKSHNNKVSITDDVSLSDPTNWTGAELVLFSTTYTIDRCLITSQEGSTLYYNHPPDGTMEPVQRDGLRYMIQNDIKTLDVQNEWFYNSLNKKLTVYSTTKPVNIRVPVTEVLVTNVGTGILDRNRYIILNDIAFTGANESAIKLKSIENFTIENCDFYNLGKDGINGDYGYSSGKTGLIIKNNTFDNVNSNATLIEDNFNNVYIGHNRFTNIGKIIGLGGSGGVKNIAIYSRGNGSVIEYNTVSEIGYIGIIFGGDNTIVNNNIVEKVLKTKIDGGAIYAFTGGIHSNRKILNNVVRDAPTAAGIYLDDLVQDVQIKGNTVSNVAYGILLHGTTDIDIRDNIVYGCNHSQLYLVDEKNEQFSNIVIKNNTFFATENEQLLVNAVSHWNDLPALGIIDSNYYAKPTGDAGAFKIIRYVNKVDEYYFLNLEGWSKITNQDVNSLGSPTSVKPYKINTLIGNNLALNGGFNTDISLYDISAPSQGVSYSWDNTGKITGTGSLKIASTMSRPVNQGEIHVTFKNSIPIDSSKTYLLRFKTLSTVENKSVRAGLRHKSNWNMLTSLQSGNFGKEVKMHEYIFNKPTTDPTATLLLSFPEEKGTLYVDDIFFSEILADFYSKDSYFKLVTNVTMLSKTMRLDAKYMDVTGAIYDGPITLAPFTSAVLILVEAGVVPVSLINLKRYNQR